MLTKFIFEILKFASNLFKDQRILNIKKIKAKGMRKGKISMNSVVNVADPKVTRNIGAQHAKPLKKAGKELRNPLTGLTLHLGLVQE